MNSITVFNSLLPSSIEELNDFIIVGHEKLNAVRAAIRAIDKIGQAKEVHDRMVQEATELNEAVIDAETKLGTLTLQMPKAQKGTGVNQYTKSAELQGGMKFSKTNSNAWFGEIYDNDAIDEYNDRLALKEANYAVTKTKCLKEMNISRNQASDYERMAKHPEIVEQAKAEARESNELVTRQSIIKKIKAVEKKQEVLEAEKRVQAEVTEKYQAQLTVGDGIGYVPAEKYDLLLTDPPYSTDVEDINAFIESWLFNALDNVKSTGFAYIFIGAYPEEVKTYLNAKIPEHMKLEQMLVWTYKNTLGNNPKDRYKLNYQICLFYRGVDAPDLNCPLTAEQWAVQEINAPDGRQGDRYHAWQKPMEIAERFIRHSTEQDMLVFDPFACTGTFLLAAAKLGRKGYGFEINPENAKIAYERGCIHG